MNHRDLQQSLDAFTKNPKAEMSRVPEKRDASGKRLDKPATLFEPKDLQDGQFVVHRDSLRKNFSTVIDGAVISVEDCIPGKAPIEAIDRPENLVDALRYTDLAAMEAAGLTAGAVKTQPWSDDYWALYAGCLGKRYADPEFPASKNWKENYDYVLAHPAREIVADGDDDAINQLSPAEKYDLLTGDSAGSLTSAMWAQGKSYFDRTGSVETWMGICHGWAPASYMLPRPVKPVTLLAADGATKLTFYPADLKGLASLLWATAHATTKFIGGRCNTKDPPSDDNGRVLLAQAFDTNPATWHLTVVNQVGAAGRSFVMDATFDYEVWNQPISTYRYQYFNPQDMKVVTTLAEATVSCEQFTNDKFKKYRSKDAVAVVGVAMEVTYIRETAPQAAEQNGPDDDATLSVTYKYDLELDAQNRLIGGEWYTGKCHPDFLWTPPVGTRATSPAEQYATESWNPEQQLPPTWRRAATSAASRGMPLAQIIELLLKLASA